MTANFAIPVARRRTMINLPGQAAPVLAVLACQTGVFYYVTQVVLGVPFQNPLIIFGALLVCLAFLLHGVSVRETLPTLVFVALNLALCFTALWSTSMNYSQDKVIGSLTFAPIVFIAGYLIARQNRATMLGWATVGLGLLAWIGFVRDDGASLLTGPDAVANYQNFGIAAGLAVAVAAGMAAFTWHRAIRIAMAVAAVPLLWLMLNCGGRTGLLMLGAAGLVTAWPLIMRHRGVMLAVAAAFAGLMAMLWNTMLDAMNKLALDPQAPATLSRVSYNLLYGDRHDPFGTRSDLLFRAQQQWHENLLFGVGWGGFPSAAGLPDIGGFYPHNIVMELLAETGLVGFALAATVVGVIVWRYGRATAQGETHGDRVTWIVLVSGFAAAMVSGDWPANRILWLGLGLAAGSTELRRVWVERGSAARAASRAQAPDLAPDGPSGVPDGLPAGFAASSGPGTVPSTR